MSKAMAKKIKKWYPKYWNIDQVKDAVIKKVITAEEYKEITAEEYKEITGEEYSSSEEA